jgi:ATP-dependent DNA helicase 2 subunit 1
VTIEPFFISTANKPFDPTISYIEILSRNTDSSADDHNEDLQLIPDVIQGFDRLLEDIKIRETPKRALFSIPFTLGDGFTIGIKGYGLVTPQKKGNFKYFIDRGRDGLVEASSRAVYFEDVSGESRRVGRLTLVNSISGYTR